MERVPFRDLDLQYALMLLLRGSAVGFTYDRAHVEPNIAHEKRNLTREEVVENRKREALRKTWTARIASVYGAIAESQAVAVKAQWTPTGRCIVRLDK